MSIVLLRFIAIYFVTIALTACGKTEGQAATTPQQPVAVAATGSSAESDAQVEKDGECWGAVSTANQRHKIPFDKFADASIQRAKKILANDNEFITKRLGQFIEGCKDSPNSNILDKNSPLNLCLDNAIKDKRERTLAAGYVFARISILDSTPEDAIIKTNGMCSGVQNNVAAAAPATVAPTDAATIALKLAMTKSANDAARCGIIFASVSGFVIKNNGDEKDSTLFAQMAAATAYVMEVAETKKGEQKQVFGKIMDAALTETRNMPADQLISNATQCKDKFGDLWKPMNEAGMFTQARTAVAPAATTTPAAAPAPAAAAANVPSVGLLEQASKCSDLEGCIGFMLQGADSRKQEVMQMAAARIADFPKPEKGDRKAARELNKKALELLTKSDYTGAIALLHQATGKDPKDVEILSNLGLVFVKAGKAAEAEKALKGALLLEPKRTSSWTPLAESFDLEGKSDLAVSALLVGYEFSGNKDKTVTYFTDKSTTAERNSMKSSYINALAKIKAQ